MVNRSDNDSVRVQVPAVRSAKRYKDFENLKGATMKFGKSEKIDILRKNYQYRGDPEKFEPGDLIIQRDGTYLGTTVPGANEVCILIEYRETVSTGKGDLVRDQDIILGTVDNEGDFMIFPHASWKFRKATDSEINPPVE
jgi:hypothetical protein